MGNSDCNTIDAIHFRLDWSHGILARYYYHNTLLVDLIGSARDTLMQTCNPLSAPERALSESQSRPRFIITKEQLEFLVERHFSTRSEGSKSSTHYLGDKNRFDISSKGPSLGTSVGGRGKHACFYTMEYIKTTRDKIKTNQMDLIKTQNK